MFSIDITSIQNEDMDGKLQTAVNSGDMPDLFMARGGGKLADIVDAGAVKDLSDLISEDTKAAYGDAPFSAFTIEGAVYGVPVAVLPEGVFHSQDLFAEAGVEATPTTFDELNDVVDKLKDSGTEPIALGAKDACAGRALVLLVRAPRMRSGDDREHRGRPRLQRWLLAAGSGGSGGVRGH